jgi:uncharacterized protein YqjF (DUF2071 family)
VNERPSGRPAIYMEWRNLLFLHWPVPAAVLRDSVPAGLRIDTFDGTAWVGLVPFTMPSVRHAGWPRIPTMHRFHECNVRTYVTDEHGESGVWFFSLDAASWLAVIGARWLWHLEYVHARIELERVGSSTSYRLHRVRDPATGMRCRWEAGAPMPRSRPGSREHFLTERYSMFARDGRGRLWRGRIWHEPWALQSARLLELDGNLVAASTGVEAAAFAVNPICWHAERLDVSAWTLEPV